MVWSRQDGGQLCHWLTESQISPAEPLWMALVHPGWSKRWPTCSATTRTLVSCWDCVVGPVMERVHARLPIHMLDKTSAGMALSLAAWAVDAKQMNVFTFLALPNKEWKADSRGWYCLLEWIFVEITKCGLWNGPSQDKMTLYDKMAAVIHWVQCAGHVLQCSCSEASVAVVHLVNLLNEVYGNPLWAGYDLFSHKCLHWLVKFQCVCDLEMPIFIQSQTSL